MMEKTHGRHPTQKPLRLLHRCVLACTAQGEVVFDPFSGSGTSGVAAKELGRFFVRAETERGYAELAGRRIGAVVRGEVLRGLPLPAG
jgi:site-specific DNA-methyltransferase (adenine-specific)